MPDIKNKRLAILMVMLTLGTAWAIRGRFGHEYGAAWAGALGVLSLVLASGRKDWIRNWPTIMAIGAIGWGMTGMISYGIVIGYGRGIDFINVSYGLLGLMVIGGLFGFLGGGLTGLLLETSESKKPKWAELITQMLAGGMIAWGALIYQFELYMTPPRSELWAGCLGAAVMLAWYMQRNGYHKALIVARYAMLGGGFGFAFGNFIQTMGHVSGISFNWWNVMEYSIGFCGGLGMAYGVFSQKWEQMPKASVGANTWASILIFVFIPFLIFMNSFHWDKVAGMGERLSMTDIDQFVTSQWIQVMILSLVALTIITLQIRKSLQGQATYKNAYFVLFAYWLWYFLLRTISSGTFYEYHFSSDDLAIPNLIVVLLFLWRMQPNPEAVFQFPVAREILQKNFRIAFAAIIATLLILAAISMNCHDEEPPGLRKRFGNTTEVSE